MSTHSYFLINLLPIVFVVAATSFLVGQVLGWLFWSNNAAEALAVESQNENLRAQIRRLKTMR